MPNAPQKSIAPRPMTAAKSSFPSRGKLDFAKLECGKPPAPTEGHGPIPRWPQSLLVDPSALHMCLVLFFQLPPTMFKLCHVDRCLFHEYVKTLIIHFKFGFVVINPDGPILNCL